MQEVHNYFLEAKNLIKFSMTKQEFDDSISEGMYGNITKEYQLIVHEYSHWVQSAGTPYGFFLRLVNHYEKELLEEIIGKISVGIRKTYSTKISLPFQKYILGPHFADIKDKELWDLFSKWVDLYCFIEANTHRRDEYYDIVNDPEGFINIFVDHSNGQNSEFFMYLPLLYDRVDNLLLQKNKTHLGYECSEKNYSQEIFYSKENWRASIVTGLNGSSLQITPHSLWESYATVIEYVDIPERFVFPSQFDVCGNKKEWNEYYDPLRYLELYLPSANYNASLFLRTCVILFDIVFSPPILPQCFALRKGKVSFFDFDIVSRFYAVAEAAKYIGAIDRYRSNGEYSAAICRVLKWHTPDEVYIEICKFWDSLPVIPEGRMFQYFIRSRISGEYLMLNRKRFMSEVALGHVFPCFLDFTDCRITNTRLFYNSTIEAFSELRTISFLLGVPITEPEPLEYNSDYYKYILLQDLINKIWYDKDSRIELSLPKQCECIDEIKNYLEAWIEALYIKVQICITYES